MTGMTPPVAAIRTARRSKRSSTTKTTSSFTPRCLLPSRSRRRSGLPLQQSRPWIATIMSALISSLKMVGRWGTTLDAYISQGVGDELPRIKPTPPPVPAHSGRSSILIYFDDQPVKVQYETVRNELRVAHCFKELDDVSHAFDHLIIMLLMLPRTKSRDDAVETIVNMKMEFFGHEDETNGLPGTASEGAARRGHSPVQGNVRRGPHSTELRGSRSTERQAECPIRYRDQ